MAGVALPWGADEPVEADLPAAQGLSLGARLEVRWDVEVEGSEPTTQWWAAALHSREDGKADGEGRQVYVLRYDQAPELGFEEHEESEVTFVDAHLLYDFGQEHDLVWRREGEAWEAPPPPEADGPEGPVFTLKDIVSAISTGERRRGRTMEQDMSAALAELPPDRRLLVADSFSQFADRIVQGMVQLHRRRGSDYVVTADDMQEVTDAARAAVAQSGLGGRL